MTDTHERFSAAIELGVRLDNDWRQLERRIRDTIPDLAAAAYDREPTDPIVWCWDHQRSVKDCRRHDEFCTGTPLEKRTDPTGDGAVGSTAYRDAGEYTAHAKRAAHHIEQMARIAGRYKPDDPQLSLDVEEANTKEDTCAICARSEKWVPKAGKVGTQDVCTFHLGFHQRHGRHPNPDEEATHQRGKRVTARVSQMDRLRGALTSGKL